MSVFCYVKATVIVYFLIILQLVEAGTCYYIFYCSFRFNLKMPSAVADEATMWFTSLQSLSAQEDNLKECPPNPRLKN